MFCLKYWRNNDIFTITTKVKRALAACVYEAWARFIGVETSSDG